MSWTYVQCTTTQYGVISGNDTVTCYPCPDGGACDASVALDVAALQAANVTSNGVSTTASGLDGVVVQQGVVARSGYWAPSNSDGSTFYACPIADACLAGGNGTRSRCADGYVGVLCSVCADGYFEQFGKYVRRTRMS